ncbi:MAG: putative ABC exporter domain-containing protein [Oscillospiraceae bacterium]|nr:putative ABC exporter domain-containing protein [Oscillospiraceae bacterium]
MKCLIYLTVTKIKNKILETLRKPVKLIVSLAAVLFFGFIIFSALTGGGIPEISETGEPRTYPDLVWLKGMLFGIILLTFFLSIASAFKNGNKIFEMSDVNLLFVSPLKPQSILLYGVARMMSSSLLAGFFILFQGALMRNVFGIPGSSVLFLTAGFILAVCLTQILTLFIYSLTNGNKKRKSIAKCIIAACFIPMVVIGIMQFIQNDGDIMTSLETLLRSPATELIPVVGWASVGAIAFISGQVLKGLVYFGAIFMLGAFLIAYIYLSRPDYYEDTLVATETTFEKMRALSEGQLNVGEITDRKIKTVRTGIGGMGSSALFFKHLRESFRAKRFGLWGVGSLFLIGAAAAYAFYSSAASESGVQGGVLLIMQVIMWIQIMRIGSGRGLKELYSHYIYMIPESSLKKIIWSNMEEVFKIIGESVFIFGISGFIMKESPLVIMGAVLVYSMFSLLLIAVNLLYLRFTEMKINSGLMITIYYITIFIVILPGLIPAIIIGSIEGFLFVGLLVFAGWEVAAAVGIFALSKGILHKCDMPVIKMN